MLGGEAWEEGLVCRVRGSSILLWLGYILDTYFYIEREMLAVCIVRLLRNAFSSSGFTADPDVQSVGNWARGR